jgi:methylsterol monooxygenase
MKIENEFTKGMTKLTQIIFALTIFIGLPLLGQYVWPKKISNPVLFRILIGPSINCLAFLLSNVFFGILYTLKHPAIERYKCNNQPWPWEEDPKGWKILFRKTILLVSFYNLILAPLFSLAVNFNDYRQPRLDYDSLPSIPVFIAHLLICIIAEDIMFYFGHRLLHSKYLYKRIHKVHHDHKVTISLASEYAHPVEFVIGNIIPTMAGTFILGTNIHCYTQMCWIFIRICETSVSHSGYNFPVSISNLIPFATESDFHNYHHLNFKDNYGSQTKIWDYLCKTIGKDYKIKLKKGL